jgi:hypothetical protein
VKAVAGEMQACAEQNAGRQLEDARRVAQAGAELLMSNRARGGAGGAPCMDFAGRSSRRSVGGHNRNMPRRRARATMGTCHICLRERPLSFEHVPPSAAVNVDKLEVRGLKHWLERNNDGIRLRHVIRQGGFGFSRLCEACNNRTGSWYGTELTGWVHAAVAAIHALPSVPEMDAQLKDHSVMFRIEGVRPLAMIKQIITMVLVVNDVEFAMRHPDLRAFVLDRDRTHLQDVQIYLALYLGPIVRFVGMSGRADFQTSEAFV